MFPPFANHANAARCNCDRYTPRAPAVTGLAHSNGPPTLLRRDVPCHCSTRSMPTWQLPLVRAPCQGRHEHALLLHVHIIRKHRHVVIGGMLRMLRLLRRSVLSAGGAGGRRRLVLIVQRAKAPACRARCSTEWMLSH